MLQKLGGDMEPTNVAGTRIARALEEVRVTEFTLPAVEKK